METLSEVLDHTDAVVDAMDGLPDVDQLVERSGSWGRPLLVAVALAAAAVVTVSLLRRRRQEG
jgi:hypothetical protein